MMIWTGYFIASLLVFARLNAAQESGWQTNQVNATMCQWQEPRAAVIRDTVYLDGGYMWWLPGMSDGSYAGPTQDGNPLGLVYLLNFSTPFKTNQNLSQIFTTISKAPNNGAANNIGPQYYDGAMFANDGEWYTYGGLLTQTDAFALPGASSVKGYEEYWYGASGKKFDPGFIDGVLPDGVTRYVTYGGGVSIPSENKGYYFGGMRSASSGPIFYPSANKTLNADTISNTLISVDMTNEQGEVWRNQTLPTSVPGRANPELVWIPTSKSGVLIAIGGVVDPVYASPSSTLNTTQMVESQAESPKFMSTVAVYDIATESWFMQQTNGQPPGALTQGCTVVASAEDNSSHNIYWYGGFDGIEQSKSFSDSVWVLSIPSFTWIRVNSGTTTHGRAGHKCFKPYPDQMLVIGGYTAYQGNSLTCVEGGIVQVFNLSSVQWMNSYDPDSWSNYSVPSVITTTVGGTGAGGASTRAPPTWANQSMAAIFSAPYDATKIKNWYPYTVSNVSTNNTRPSAMPSNNGGSNLPSWLAPVLGVVLGLIVVSAIVVCIILWRRRRYLRRQSTTMTGTSDMNRHRVLSWVRGNPETKAPTVTSSEEGPTSPYDVESPMSGVVVSEAAGNQVHEMPDTSRIQELSGTGMSYIAHTPKAGIRPTLSQSSQYSVASSLTTSPSSAAISPVLNFSSPRPDSPSLGSERVASGVSSLGSSSEKVPQVPTIITPPDEEPERAKGLSLTSPVSPPTPTKGGEVEVSAADYLASRRPAPHPLGGAGTRGKPEGKEDRRSAFGEMLDEK